MGTVSVKLPTGRAVAIDTLKPGQFARVIDPCNGGCYIGTVVFVAGDTRAVCLDGSDTAWSWSRELDDGCPLLVEVLPPGTVITIVV